MSCLSIPFGLEPSDRKRTRRLAAPSAAAAPKAAAVLACESGGAASAEAPAAVDPTRQCFPGVFEEGIWPTPKAGGHPTLTALYPHTYSVLPGMMPEPTRLEITLEDTIGSNEKIPEIIEKEGVVNLPAHVLQAATGKDLFLAARAEAHALFYAQYGPGGVKWDSLFHDKADLDLKEKIHVGDGYKIMSDNLPWDSKIVQFVETAASNLRPGYGIGREPDGRPHIVVMNHLNPPKGFIELFSREHYGQEQHDDLPVHGGGAKYSGITPQACLREDAPLVMWVSFSNDPISLFFFLKSHIIGRLVSLFFVHHAPLLAE